MEKYIRHEDTVEQGHALEEGLVPVWDGLDGAWWAPSENRLAQKRAREMVSKLKK